VRRPDELEDVMRLLRIVRPAGVESVLGGPLDTSTSVGLIQARIKVVFDAAYSDFISERVTLAKRERAERGLPPGGGVRPFRLQGRRNGHRTVRSDTYS
jgi:DNA invertase Pin-like site-specific DNA recombinase